MTALLVYFFIALVVSFLCSLLESVLLSVSHAHIAVLVKEGSKRGKLMFSLKENINRPLSAILTFNTIANTVGAAGVGAQTYSVFGSSWVAISSIILTLSILFFSEIIPKTLGANYTKSLVGFTAYMIRILIFLVFPMVFLGEKISKFLSRDNQDNSKASRAELIAMAELSEDEGAIDSQEGDIIENLMKLDNILAEEVMTPRSVIFSLSDEDTVGKVVNKYSPLVFSRIPIFKNSLDQVIGFVHRYDLVNKQAEDKFDVTMSSLMEPVHTVKDSDSVSTILDQFVKRRQQIFIVEDEFGTTTGLISLEDAIETLLGVEIVDEHDSVVDMRKLASAKLEKRQQKERNKNATK
ncbi:HlyC/CorC family transporter [bacterium]|mgnify:FL=1|jgi:CBS domain containing-hemolysin-like protein|nr:HlyC/CorC family transporter [bacterium]MBT4248805.1 HlyC/CorC family transporter [bacterium]MBT4928189.1 HlyC/CorC family transporter [bacterium]MBT5733210.1 HlyC/CorC family transporter [bacterium]MBT6777855.1 HlyC/CorC family transporter [bacterium]